IGLCWHRSPGAKPYQTLKGLKDYWERPEAVNDPWKAPNGIYWICGEKAYSELLRRWRGSCTLGIIRPSSFVLPRSESNLLGVPL
ncbi:ENR1 protein, partial [Daphoenositta chrysoptera]|nr:ENR1 protein [Daphoenositta chrysoptera]